MSRFLTLIVFATVLAATAQTQSRRTTSNARIIREDSPVSLPQSPGEKERPSSDAKDEAIKGPVRRIVEYCQGTIFSITDYNEAGNRVRHIQYDHGNLLSIKDYGYIDGMRVWRWAGGNDDEDPSAWKKEPPKDKRYEFREVRRYDEANRLLEIIGFLNTGEKWFRTLYVYDGNVRTSRHHDKDDRLSSTETEMLDPYGHVVEISRQDGLSEGKKWVSVYKVDERGNWVEERTHMESTDGKKLNTPTVRTRKITYFPAAKPLPAVTAAKPLRK